MDRWRRLWAWLTDDHVLFTEPGIARMFTRCLACSRVMPYWDAVYTAGERTRIGCRHCGGLRFAPTNIPVHAQVWWLFVRGLLIRRWLLRKPRWDPRLPVRAMH